MPKRRDVLLVSAAGGGVGSLVGQLGKRMGCTTIVVSSSEENAPEGIGIFFDNVDEFSQAIGKLSQSIKEGSLHSPVDITVGIDNTAVAFCRMLAGKTRGECLVKVCGRITPGRGYGRSCADLQSRRCGRSRISAGRSYPTGCGSILLARRYRPSTLSARDASTRRERNFFLDLMWLRFMPVSRKVATS